MSRRTCFAATLAALLGGAATVACASTSNPTFLAVPPLTPLAQTASVDVTGSVGGAMTVGRFTVRIARGAFTGTSRVTVFVPDPTVLMCNVTMSPLPVFKTKPTLEANYSGAAGTARSFWWVNYSPSTALWSAASSVSITTTLTKITETPSVLSQHGVVGAKTGW